MSSPGSVGHRGTAFIRDLRLTVNFLGIDALAEYLRSAPADQNFDNVMLIKLAHLLRMVVDEQELEYSRVDASEVFEQRPAHEVPYARIAENNGLPYVLVGENKGPDDGDASIYAYDPISHTDDDLNENADDNPPDVDWTNIEVSKAAFPELFPTKKITRKKQLHKSFPNIDEFRANGIHFLTSGNFGMTFKSVLKGVPVVLKVSKMRSEEANRADYHEWSISEKLKPHSNVLQIIGLCPSFDHPMHASIGTTALIAPLKQNGGLRAFFDNREKRDGDIMDMAFGMIAGIRSLHEQRVVHRDIAVRNFLVDCDGRVLLCDFGLTEFIPDGSDAFHGPPSEVLPWRILAPESFHRIFSTKSDIWMYGLALVELLSKEPMWSSVKTPGELRKSLEENEIKLPDMEGFPSIIAEIVRDCLQFDPSLRPSAGDIAERLVKSQFKDAEESRDEDGNTHLHQLAMNANHWMITRALKKDQPIMINGVNNRGETPLMLAKSKKVQKALLSYRKVPLFRSEPSRIPEYFHNIDVFGTFLKLAQREDVEGITSLGRLGLHDSAKQMHKQRDQWNGETPLHIAARTGNTELFDVLVGLKLFDERKTNTDSQTALHVASINGHAVIVEKLMSLQDNVKPEGIRRASTGHLVNFQDKVGKTALHLAAQYGNVSATCALLDFRSTNVNLADARGRSPMFDSLSGASTNQETQVAILQKFLDHPSVDINKTDSRGETISHKAAREGNARATSVLIHRTDLQLSVREHEHGYTPLHLAIRELSAGVVKVLLSRDDININEPDKFNNSPLHIIAKSTTLSGNKPVGQNTTSRKEGKEIAKMLVAHSDVEINKPGGFQRAPLHEAAARNNVIVLTELLAHSEIDVNAKDIDINTPLQLAAREKCVDAAKLLLERSDIHADARNRRRSTPLNTAVKNGQVIVAKLLLSKNNVDTNARDVKKQTPLHWAARNVLVEVAKLLLSRGDVDVNVRDDIQQTPLHVAAEKGSGEIARLLLSNDDVDVNAPTALQRTPLHEVAENGSVKVAKLLLLRDDIDADARDFMQQTALHLAAAKDNVEVVKLLLAAEDVDVDARDFDGNTALDVARKKNASACVALLQDLNRGDAHPEA